MSAECALSSLALFLMICSPSSSVLSLLPYKYVEKPSPKEAYAVVILNNDYLIPANVMSLALQDTATSKDHIAMCTNVVTEESKSILQAQGWAIRPATMIITNQNKRKFADEYLKLHAWNMSEYRRVVYLDLDVMVTTNIDRLFNCGAFCALYTKYDLFSTSVMVIEPSTAVFQDLIEKARTLSTYYSGVEGFLNEYFKDFIYAAVFNWTDGKEYQQHLRLPRDVHHCMIINQFFHKPWLWWTNRYSENNRKWTNMRKRLGVHSSIRMISPIFWAPYPLAVIISLAAQHFSKANIANTCLARKLITFNKRFSHFISPFSLCLSYFFSFNLVPSTMLRGQAEYVFWLWTSFFLYIFFATYCGLCHAARGKSCYMPASKIALTLILFVVFTASHILQVTAPPSLQGTKWHIKEVFLPLVLQFLTCQICGELLIYAWTKH